MKKMLALFLIISCAAFTATAKETPVITENEPVKTIYLVNHGWHVGIVLLRNDSVDSNLAVAEDFPNAQYLEIGWGDWGFYQTPDPHPGIYLNALFLPSDSVLHIVGFSGIVTSYFRNNEIIRIEIPSTAFSHLVDAIAASFALDEFGNLKALERGLYGDSRFYASNESYHLFNTCNIWVARLLQTAGLAINPSDLITAGSLMSHAEEFGTVLQSAP